MRLVKQGALILATLAAALILSPSAASASSLTSQVPALAYPLSKTVVDTADVFTPEQEAQLDRQFRSIYDKSDTRIAFLVDTVASLEGKSISDYAATRVEALGIQPLLESKGVFIVLAPNDEQVHFDVGAGLTSRVSNETSNAIIKSQVTPNFPSGDYYTGISNGVTGLTDAYKTNAPTSTVWYRASYVQSATPYIVGGSTILVGVILMLSVMRKRKENIPAVTNTVTLQEGEAESVEFMPFANIIGYNSSSKH